MKKLILILTCLISGAAVNGCRAVDLNLNISIAQQSVRKWTFMIYIAADNDLSYFAWNTIKQLARVAAPDVNILVFLNEPDYQNPRTQIYLIEPHRAFLLNKTNQQKFVSGDPQTLINFCNWAITNFPADEYLLRTLANS